MFLVVGCLLFGLCCVLFVDSVLLGVLYFAFFCVGVSRFVVRDCLLFVVRRL